MAKIGKNILENLTTGMYSDSKVCFREYIQNACDQIDLAVKTGLMDKGEAEINIYTDPTNRNISVEDNATGVPASDFVSKLGDVANSDKKIGENKGFRGIGRLCGLAYCRTLIFSTTCKGEAVGSRMVYDAKKMRDMIASDQKIEAEDVLNATMTVSTFSEDAEKHYFKVELLGINKENTDLLDEDKIRDYLSYVAPAPYTNKFIFRNRIYEHAKEMNTVIDEYDIFLNGQQIFKEYRTSLYEASGNQKKVYDEINNISFKDFVDGDGKLIAWLWFGISRFEKAIPKKLNPMFGFRLRQGNIQIGRNSAVNHLFRENRGNSYFVGEIFAVDRRLIPNSQRDYFNENEQRKYLEDCLREFFSETLQNLYYKANDVKNAFKRLQAYNDERVKLENKQKKGFLNKEEEVKAHKTVEEALKDRDNALKRLNRLYNQATSCEGAFKAVFKAIQKNYEEKGVTLPAGEPETNPLAQPGTSANAQEGKTDPNGQEPVRQKTKYFTDNLNKLDRKQRKLVRDIMALVKKVVPNSIEEIQNEIIKKYG